MLKNKEIALFRVSEKSGDALATSLMVSLSNHGEWSNSLALCPQRVQPLDESGGGAIAPGRILLAFHHWQKFCRQFLAKLDAPLVEGIDAKQRGFHEHPVLIKCDQPSERERIERSIKDRHRRPGTGEYAMRGQATGLRVVHPLSE